MPDRDENTNSGNSKLEMPKLKTKDKAPKTKKQRHWAWNWFINLSLIGGSSLFTLLAIFLAGEIWIRSQELPEDTGSVYTRRADQVPRYVLTPNAEEISTGTQVKINSLGFRGHEYSQEKPEGTKRIVVLGDSFAFGAGAPVDVIFAARLEKMLNREKTFGPVEVLNLGVSDYNSDDQLALLKEKGLGLSPDLVMVFYVMNDIEIKKEYLPAPEPKPNQSKQTQTGERPFRDPLYNIVHNLRKHSKFLAYLAPRIASLGRSMGFNVTSSSAFYRTAFADNVEGWQRSKAALREMQRLGDEQNYRFALVLFPLMTNFTDKYPAKRSHEVIGEFAKENNIPFLDLLDSYMGKSAQSLWVSPTDGHPNAEGHKIAADAVLQFLKNQPVLLGDA